MPVVQALHNYHLFCVNGLFLRDGRKCEDCLRRVPWLGVARCCYRGEFGSSVAVAAMTTVHRWRGTWNSDVDLYLRPSKHMQDKAIVGSLPPEQTATRS